MIFHTIRCDMTFELKKNPLVVKTDIKDQYQGSILYVFIVQKYIMKMHLRLSAALLGAGYVQWLSSMVDSITSLLLEELTHVKEMHRGRHVLAQSLFLAPAWL